MGWGRLEEEVLSHESKLILGFDDKDSRVLAPVKGETLPVLLGEPSSIQLVWECVSARRVEHLCFVTPGTTVDAAVSKDILITHLIEFLETLFPDEDEKFLFQHDLVSSHKRPRNFSSNTTSRSLNGDPTRWIWTL